MEQIPDLYRKHFVDKQDERNGLFKKLSENFQIERGLYPGSFVHITPSFYISQMTYIDLDKRCERFFSSQKVLNFIDERKQYSGQCEIEFFKADFTKKLELKKNYYNLLLSFYAGFISQNCKQFLKKGGILVVNNSHGDAPLAYLDADFRLISVVKRNGTRFSISDKNLSDYFQLKNGKLPDKEKIISTMKGPGYKKSAYAYIFKKI